MTMKKLLRIENLTKGQILHQITFDMEQGEMVAVMGPSCSGKSTLLYNAAGMDQPDGGQAVSLIQSTASGKTGVVFFGLKVLNECTGIRAVIILLALSGKLQYTCL